VLLGDADVDHAAGEALVERQQPGGVGHRGGERDQVGVLLGRFDERLGERRGVAARLHPGPMSCRFLMWSFSAGA
jgi:hypothetical protein